MNVTVKTKMNGKRKMSRKGKNKKEWNDVPSQWDKYVKDSKYKNVEE